MFPCCSCAGISSAFCFGFHGVFPLHSRKRNPMETPPSIFHPLSETPPQPLLREGAVLGERGRWVKTPRLSARHDRCLIKPSAHSAKSVYLKGWKGDKQQGAETKVKAATRLQRGRQPLCPNALLTALFAPLRKSKCAGMGHTGHKGTRTQQREGAAVQIEDAALR